MDSTIQGENQTCKTKYPILLVHGVFFRDRRYFNYWGRIPQELKRKGAVLDYGNQQSAASVAECGKELAEKIREMVAARGCEKVNIIAHSKGGLDARYAISCCGAAAQVASLTTINTPHKGCFYAEHLLEKTAGWLKHFVARKYNRTMRRLGDTNPDFLAAVRDLTPTACEALNTQMPDAPGVYYQSVMSYMKHPSSDKFPMNFSYRFAKKYDGPNDGMVSVESGTWQNCRLVEPEGDKGISHWNIVDFTRKNVQDFDVRRLYTELVGGLAGKGL